MATTSTNTSALSAFRDLSNSIVGAAINSITSYKYLDIIEGVKGPTRFNVVSPEVNLSTANCNRTALSGVSYSWVNLDPSMVSDYTQYCGDELTPYLAKFQTPGSMIESIPFGQFVLELRGLKWAQTIEELMWQGNVNGTGSTTNLRKCNGFLRAAGAASASTVNVVYTAMTVANAAVVMRDYTRQIPTIVKNKQTKLFLPYTDMLTWFDYLNSINSFNPANFAPNITGEENTEQIEYKIIGTSCSIVGLTALNGAEGGLICIGGTLKLGTDVPSELTDLPSFEYERSLGVWTSELKAKIAPAIALPEQVVRIYR
jgi:hypothetical protein